MDVQHIFTLNNGLIIIASEQQTVMNYEEWLEKYKPIMNPYCEAPFEGKMFETSGKELDHVHRVLENSKQSVWTYMESNGHSHIVPGYQHIDRLGYFITEVGWEDKNLTIALD